MSLNSLGKQRFETLRQFSLSIHSDPSIWKDNGLIRILNKDFTEPSDYTEFLQAIEAREESFLARVFSQIFNALNKDIVQTVGVFLDQFMLLLTEENEVNPDLKEVLAQILVESLQNQATRKDEFNRWLLITVPGYTFGPEKESQPEKQNMESNTDSDQRLALLKEWIQTVGSGSLEDTEQARESLNRIRSLQVENGATYVQWFDELRGLVKDLLNKSAKHWNLFAGSSVQDCAEIVRRLLLPLNASWVNENKKAQFEILCKDLFALSNRGSKNAYLSLKSFASKAIPKVMFEGGIQIETFDEEEPPTFSVGIDPEEMEEEKKSKKRKPLKDKSNTKKTKKNTSGKEEEPAFPRRSKRQIVNEDEDDLEPPKKSAGFEFKGLDRIEEDEPVPVPQETSGVKPAETLPNWKDFLPKQKEKKTRTPKVPKVPKEKKHSRLVNDLLRQVLQYRSF
jgi:hypothetical protein